MIIASMIVLDTLYRSVSADEYPDFSTDCENIPRTAPYLKLVMGLVNDYFRPTFGSSYCEMLLSNKLHQWSPDGIHWQTPDYYDNTILNDENFGGSAENYASNIDGRVTLSFWKGMKGLSGGCCTSAYNDKFEWGHAFKIFIPGLLPSIHVMIFT